MNPNAQPQPDGYEIYREGEINYSKPLARALLRDSRLSFGARGLFSFLWDLPAGWRTNSKHLASISIHGRDAIRTLLKELERVGAMRSEVQRDARGKMAGKRWVLVSPERWAKEGSLSASKKTGTQSNGASSEGRDFRPSENPKFEKSNTKVPQKKGSANLSTTTSENIEDLVCAAIWAYRKGGGVLRNEAGFKHTIRERFHATGATAEDIESLDDWRKYQTKVLQEKAEQSARQKNGNRESNLATVDAAFSDIHKMFPSLKSKGGKRVGA